MVKSKGDALLVAARVLTVLIVAILVVGTIAIAVGICVLFTIGRSEVYELIGRAGAPDETFWIVIAGFAIGMIATAFAAAFFRVLHTIILSVDRDRPFDPANAQRLRQMGWLGIAGQILLFPMDVIVSWLAPYLRKLGETVDIDLGLDPAAILLILILFILAGVFERGAGMETDLEGTV